MASSQYGGVQRPSSFLTEKASSGEEGSALFTALGVPIPFLEATVSTETPLGATWAFADMLARHIDTIGGSLITGTIPISVMLPSENSTTSPAASTSSTTVAGGGAAGFQQPFAASTQQIGTPPSSLFAGGSGLTAGTSAGNGDERKDSVALSQSGGVLGNSGFNVFNAAGGTGGDFTTYQSPNTPNNASASSHQNLLLGGGGGTLRGQQLFNSATVEGVRSSLDCIHKVWEDLSSLSQRLRTCAVQHLETGMDRQRKRAATHKTEREVCAPRSADPIVAEGGGARDLVGSHQLSLSSAENHAPVGTHEDKLINANLVDVNTMAEDWESLRNFYQDVMAMSEVLASPDGTPRPAKGVSSAIIPDASDGDNDTADRDSGNGLNTNSTAAFSSQYHCTTLNSTLPNIDTTLNPHGAAEAMRGIDLRERRVEEADVSTNALANHDAESEAKTEAKRRRSSVLRQEEEKEKEVNNKTLNEAPHARHDAHNSKLSTMSDEVIKFAPPPSAGPIATSIATNRKGRSLTTIAHLHANIVHFELFRVATNAAINNKSQSPLVGDSGGAAQHLSIPPLAPFISSSFGTYYGVGVGGDDGEGGGAAAPPHSLPARPPMPQSTNTLATLLDRRSGHSNLGAIYQQQQQLGQSHRLQSASHRLSGVSTNSSAGKGGGAGGTASTKSGSLSAPTHGGARSSSAYYGQSQHSSAFNITLTRADDLPGNTNIPMLSVAGVGGAPGGNTGAATESGNAGEANTTLDPFTPGSNALIADTDGLSPPTMGSTGGGGASSDTGGLPRWDKMATTSAPQSNSRSNQQPLPLSGIANPFGGVLPSSVSTVATAHRADTLTIANNTLHSVPSNLMSVASRLNVTTTSTFNMASSSQTNLLGVSGMAYNAGASSASLLSGPWAAANGVPNIATVHTSSTHSKKERINGLETEENTSVAEWLAENFTQESDKRRKAKAQFVPPASAAAFEGGPAEAGGFLHTAMSALGNASVMLQRSAMNNHPFGVGGAGMGIGMGGMAASMSPSLQTVIPTTGDTLFPDIGLLGDQDGPPPTSFAKTHGNAYANRKPSSQLSAELSGAAALSSASASPNSLSHSHAAKSLSNSPSSNRQHHGAGGNGVGVGNTKELNVEGGEWVSDSDVVSEGGGGEGGGSASIRVSRGGNGPTTENSNNIAAEVRGTDAALDDDQSATLSYVGEEGSDSLGAFSDGGDDTKSALGARIGEDDHDDVTNDATLVDMSSSGAFGAGPRVGGVQNHYARKTIDDRDGIVSEASVRQLLQRYRIPYLDVDSPDFDIFKEVGLLKKECKKREERLQKQQQQQQAPHRERQSSVSRSRQESSSLGGEGEEVREGTQGVGQSQEVAASLSSGVAPTVSGQPSPANAALSTSATAAAAQTVSKRSSRKQVPNNTTAATTSPSSSLSKRLQRRPENIFVFVCMNVVMRYVFVSNFNINIRKLLNYLLIIQSLYREENPYHNSLHAADVLQTTHIYLTSNGVHHNFSDLEIFCLLFSALVHDVGHLGISNMFLIKTRHPLAVLYNDKSPLENMHTSIALHLFNLPEYNFLADGGKWTDDMDADFRHLVTDIVSGTDMKFHASIISNVNDILADGVIEDEEISMLMKAIVHAADLSNPMKPKHLYLNWMRRVNEEFWLQGDEEAANGLPISVMCDRRTTKLPESQVGFINFIVKPFVQAFAVLLPDVWVARLDENLNYMMDMVAKNKSKAAAAASALSASTSANPPNFHLSAPTPSNRSLSPSSLSSPNLSASPVADPQERTAGPEDAPPLLPNQLNQLDSSANENGAQAQGQENGSVLEVASDQEDQKQQVISSSSPRPLGPLGFAKKEGSSRKDRGASVTHILVDGEGEGGGVTHHNDEEEATANITSTGNSSQMCSNSSNANLAAGNSSGSSHPRAQNKGRRQSLRWESPDGTEIEMDPDTGEILNAKEVAEAAKGAGARRVSRTNSMPSLSGSRRNMTVPTTHVANKNDSNNSNNNDNNKNPMSLEELIFTNTERGGGVHSEKFAKFLCLSKPIDRWADAFVPFSAVIIPQQQQGFCSAMSAPAAYGGNQDNKNNSVVNHATSSFFHQIVPPQTPHANTSGPAQLHVVHGGGGVGAAAMPSPAYHGLPVLLSTGHDAVNTTNNSINIKSDLNTPLDPQESAGQRSDKKGIAALVGGSNPMGAATHTSSLAGSKSWGGGVGPMLSVAGHGTFVSLALGGGITPPITPSASLSHHNNLLPTPSPSPTDLPHTTSSQSSTPSRSPSQSNVVTTPTSNGNSLAKGEGPSFRGVNGKYGTTAATIGTVGAVRNSPASVPYASATATISPATHIDPSTLFFVPYESYSTAITGALSFAAAGGGGSQPPLLPITMPCVQSVLAHITSIKLRMPYTAMPIPQAASSSPLAMGSNDESVLLHPATSLPLGYESSRNPIVASSDGTNYNCAARPSDRGAGAFAVSSGQPISPHRVSPSPVISDEDKPLTRSISGLRHATDDVGEQHSSNDKGKDKCAVEHAKGDEDVVVNMSTITAIHISHAHVGDEVDCEKNKETQSNLSDHQRDGALLGVESASGGGSLKSDMFSLIAPPSFRALTRAPTPAPYYPLTTVRGVLEGTSIPPPLDEKERCATQGGDKSGQQTSSSSSATTSTQQRWCWEDHLTLLGSWGRDGGVGLYGGPTNDLTHHRRPTNTDTTETTATPSPKNVFFTGEEQEAAQGNNEKGHRQAFCSALPTTIANTNTREKALLIPSPETAVAWYLDFLLPQLAMRIAKLTRATMPSKQGQGVFLQTASSNLGGAAHVVQTAEADADDDKENEDEDNTFAINVLRFWLPHVTHPLQELLPSASSFGFDDAYFTSQHTFGPATATTPASGTNVNPSSVARSPAPSLSSLLQEEGEDERKRRDDGDSKENYDRDRCAELGGPSDLSAQCSTSTSIGGLIPRSVRKALEQYAKALDDFYAASEKMSVASSSSAAVSSVGVVTANRAGADSIAKTEFSHCHPLPSSLGQEREVLLCALRPYAWRLLAGIAAEISGGGGGGLSAHPYEEHQQGEEGIRDEIGYAAATKKASQRPAHGASENTSIAEAVDSPRASRAFVDGLNARDGKEGEGEGVATKKGCNNNNNSPKEATTHKGEEEAVRPHPTSNSRCASASPSAASSETCVHPPDEREEEEERKRASVCVSSASIGSSPPPPLLRHILGLTARLWTCATSALSRHQPSAAHVLGTQQHQLSSDISEKLPLLDPSVQASRRESHHHYHHQNYHMYSSNNAVLHSSISSETLIPYAHQQGQRESGHPSRSALPLPMGTGGCASPTAHVSASHYIGRAHQLPPIAHLSHQSNTSSPPTTSAAVHVVGVQCIGSTASPLPSAVSAAATNGLSVVGVVSPPPSHHLLHVQKEDAHHSGSSAIGSGEPVSCDGVVSEAITGGGEAVGGGGGGGVVGRLDSNPSIALLGAKKTALVVSGSGSSYVAGGAAPNSSLVHKTKQQGKGSAAPTTTTMTLTLTHSANMRAPSARVLQSVGSTAAVAGGAVSGGNNNVPQNYKYIFMGRHPQQQQPPSSPSGVNGGSYVPPTGYGIEGSFFAPSSTIPHTTMAISSPSSAAAPLTFLPSPSTYRSPTNGLPAPPQHGIPNTTDLLSPSASISNNNTNNNSGGGLGLASNLSPMVGTPARVLRPLRYQNMLGSSDGASGAPPPER